MSSEKIPGPSFELIVRVTQEDGTVAQKALEPSSEMLPAPEDFDITTEEGFLRDFDKLERFLLQTRDQVTNAMIDAYMQPVKKNESAGVIARNVPVESEIGRLEFIVGGALAAAVKPREILRSTQFTENAASFYASQFS